uniref:Tc1-like transposase DDE domain-containing protein n=1 Tax=Oncorhynchus tshawytscha TaxID=74940 RepID=A0AAZ3P0K0_ONCTS
MATTAFCSDAPSHLVFPSPGFPFPYHLFFNRTMTQHTFRLCKGYLTKKESDDLLHQMMTWQSPDFNPIEMVWDELDHRVKEKHPISAQHMWELLQDCWKSIIGEAG